MNSTILEIVCSLGYVDKTVIKWKVQYYEDWKFYIFPLQNCYDEYKPLVIDLTYKNRDGYFVSEYLPEVMLISGFTVTVSAFYAECISKKIQFNAHIWTKSKFLGMSIGVHNIGQGKQRQTQ